ncbi:phosphoenolpyruvate--protein phosphotransferase [Deferrisoma camini]|uniref:phosphoenolpyruvate--protein phosphotransferase n=1 Tax=Deferrisoma camini TaxID=1035120 RepID=UPI00046D1D34|nr:phosphoenolpyruvate--protein phosphotransferase [Deferrisoma camini]
MASESEKLILLEDISRIVVSSHDLVETLNQITGLLRERLGVEVCSVYLDEGGDLVLRATRGLNPEAVGRIRMAPSEGLTGLAFETGEPVNEERADAHPRFKFFPGIGEERFRSYLGVPLIHRRRPIGVLAVQTTEARRFTPDEVRLLVTAASQVAPLIAQARLLDAQARTEEPEPDLSPAPAFLRGMAVSPGFARGRAYPLTEELGLEPPAEPAPEDPRAELDRLEAAVEASVSDVEGLRAQVTQALSPEEGAIFHAHLLILEDRSLRAKIRDRILAGSSAGQAVVAVAREYIGAFLRVEDPYLRERAADVRDVALRVLGHLSEGRPPGEPIRFSRPTVVVAEDLTPSRFVQLLQPNLAGVVLAKGGRNSHTAILCRSAGIPAVMGMGDLPHVEPGAETIVDGNAGVVYFEPPEPVVQEYARLEADAAAVESDLRAHLAEPPVTRDGVRVRLLGNAALLSDVPRILEAGGEGVGLYRTEFPFLVRDRFPDEDEQVEIYRRILAALDGRVATLRTLDVGGDKSLPYLRLPREENPHLGWRSIRVSLEMDEPFRIQLRALLRAGLHGPLRIVFPMISTVEELARARAMLEDERARLARQGVEVPAVAVGIMVEVPSAVLCLDRLAPLADFFSVGTNDLVQYVLAVDRANPRVAHLYTPLHPAVLELLHRVAQVGRHEGKPVSVCGEMASRPLGAAALLALGIEDLSVSPGSLPRIRRLVQTVRSADLRALAPALLAAQGAGEVEERLATELRRQGVPDGLLAPPGRENGVFASNPLEFRHQRG